MDLTAHDVMLFQWRSPLAPTFSCLITGTKSIHDTICMWEEQDEHHF